MVFHLLRSKNYNTISYGDNKYEVLEGSAALILLTEWKEFRSPDFAVVKSKLKDPIIFDGRNQYSDLSLNDIGFKYYEIGR